MTNQTENELREKLLRYFANAMFGKKFDDLNELGKHAVSNQADGMQEIIALHRQQGDLEGQTKQVEAFLADLKKIKKGYFDIDLLIKGTEEEVVMLKSKVALNKEGEKR